MALAVGLPLAWYARERGPLAAALRGRPFRVARGAEAVTGWPDRVMVVPQGLGAAVAALGPGDAPGDYVVVDVGYRSIDYLVVRWAGGRAQADPTRAGSLELGMRAAFARAAAALEKETSIPWTAEDLPADGGDVTVRGQAVPVARWLAPATEALARQAHGAVAAALGPAFDRATVLLAGGGALALGTAWPGPARVVPDPQWANAAGFLVLLGDALEIRTAQGV